MNRVWQVSCPLQNSRLFACTLAFVNRFDASIHTDFLIGDMIRIRKNSNSGDCRFRAVNVRTSRRGRGQDTKPRSGWTFRRKLPVWTAELKQ